MLLPMRKNEIERCSQLYMEVFHSPPWHYDWITKEGTVRYFTDLYRTPGFRGFTYKVAGELTGLCMGCIFDYFTAPQYEIKEFAVSPARQRLGIGGLMLEALEDCLAQEKVAFITLMSDRHIPAFAFYQKHGFMLHDENIFMSKSISEPAQG